MAEDNNDPTKRFKDIFNSIKKFISEDLDRIMPDQGGLFDFPTEQPQQQPAQPKPPVRKPKGKGGSCDL